MNDIYLFPEPLREARLRRRKNRFIMTVELDGQEQEVHCPSTGRIGNLALEDLPCLLSSSHNPQRKTAHTVEALSLDGFDVAEKRWFGINQTAVNRYMEYFLQRQALPRMLGGQAGRVAAGFSRRRQLCRGENAAATAQFADSGCGENPPDRQPGSHRPAH